MKVQLLDIPKDLYAPIGELILLFGNIEWLIANTIFYSEIKPSDYLKVKDLSVTQKYLLVLLKLNFSRKLELLKEAGFDTIKLKSVGDYRNTITHGLIFKNEDIFTIKDISKPKAEEKELNIIKINADIEILKEEGGKLLEFIKIKGYTFHPPKN